MKFLVLETAVSLYKCIRLYEDIVRTVENHELLEIFHNVKNEFMRRRNESRREKNNTTECFYRKHDRS